MPDFKKIEISFKLMKGNMVKVQSADNKRLKGPPIKVYLMN